MKERIISLLDDMSYTGRKMNEIAHTLGVDSSDEYKSLIKLMNTLEDNGDIIRNRENEYYTLDYFHYIKGVLLMNKKGYGFVSYGEDEDIYIPKNHLNHAYHNDEVLVEKVKYKGQEEGHIIKVLKRGQTTLVGEVISTKKGYMVRPDDSRFDDWVSVDSAHLHGAMPGHKVVVEIKVYEPKLKGNVISIIGHKDEPGVDILSIVYSHNITIPFPQDVYDQLDTIDYEVKPEGRVDFRNDMIVSIDGEDAKDLDDAISLKKEGENYILGVHIADVSYYVKEDTGIDKEALERGTSIYLVDRVIPMLPQKLSNGICSLNEGKDRYTISCIMTITPTGEVIHYDIVPGIIHNKHRMTYTYVNKILDGKHINKYKDVEELFFLMKELSDILRKKRENKGAIDFDTTEAKILLDKKGKVSDVVLRERGLSEHIIEEFMLCANVTIASHFYWLDVPFIYRVHDLPQRKKLEQFLSISRPLGYTIHGSLDHINPNELSKILHKVKNKPEQPIISRLLLRSMSKARYDHVCTGHFGLADDYYTHFTSPIRRYPDLLVHRLIRKYIFNNDYSSLSYYESQIPEIAKQSSDREKRAMDTEYDVEDMKKAEYMKSHIGHIYEGMVSSVTSFGMFVELPNTIEGLVHMNTMRDDYYQYDENHMRLIGERTGRIYKLADKVRIKVIDVNINEGLIDFEIVRRKRR